MGNSSGMKRFLLWDYPRAGWQYDIMVGLILAFIFLTPREVFRDQPRATSIAQLPAQHGENVFLIDPALFAGVDEKDRAAKVESMVRSRFRRRETVVRIEPVPDSDHEIKGYLAFTRP